MRPYWREFPGLPILVRVYDVMPSFVVCATIISMGWWCMRECVCSSKIMSIINIITMLKICIHSPIIRLFKSFICVHLSLLMTDIVFVDYLHVPTYISPFIIMYFSKFNITLLLIIYHCFYTSREPFSFHHHPCNVYEWPHFFFQPTIMLISQLYMVLHFHI